MRISIYMSSHVKNTLLVDLIDSLTANQTETLPDHLRKGGNANITNEENNSLFILAIEQWREWILSGEIQNIHSITSFGRILEEHTRC